MMSRCARNLTNLFKILQIFYTGSRPTRDDTRDCDVSPLWGWGGGILSVIASWLLRGSPYRGIVRGEWQFTHGDEHSIVES